MFLFLLVSALSVGCSSTAGERTLQANVKDQPLIAVFPMENLTGTLSPARELRKALIARLERRGLRILDEKALEEVMAKHRIRYTAGLDSGTAAAIRADTGVGAVLFTSLQYYQSGVPPKISLAARLVSTGEKTEILWADGVGLAGNDAPGLLDLGIIEDPRELKDDALDVLGRSLARYLSGDTQSLGAGREGGRFLPRAAYRDLSLEPGKKYTIAIVPFFNQTAHTRNAGDIVSHFFLTELLRSGPFTVIELGEIRQAFLELRIIMQEGVSFADLDALVSMVETDFVLDGDVTEYQEAETPRVAFSVRMIERKSKKVVWSSYSIGSGADGVFFFDFGSIRNAHLLASRMVKATVNRMVKGGEISAAPVPRAGQL